MTYVHVAVAKNINNAVENKQYLKITKKVKNILSYRDKDIFYFVMIAN